MKRNIHTTQKEDKRYKNLQTDICRQMDIDTDTDRQTNMKSIYLQIDRLIEKQKDEQIEQRQINIYGDRQANRNKDRQTDRQIDREIDRHCVILINVLS